MDSFPVDCPGGPVSARRYAAGPGAPLLVLAHGAGAGQGHAFMVATARGLAERGIEVVTFDFPYVAAGRKVPDRPPVLEGCFRQVIARAGAAGRVLFIGGKSMGGRIATHLAADGLAADGLDGVRGVVVLGYPLHPPGKPAQLRVAHLPRIEVPLLVVQGTRDAFGGPDELTPHLAGLDATVHAVAGGDHSFAVPRKSGTTRAAVHAGILDAIASYLADRVAMLPRVVVK
jgi:hypothetical protein